MTQPPEGGSARHDADRSTGDGDGFSAPTSHYSTGTVGYAQPAGEQHDSAVDTSERRVVNIDESDDDDFGPATISGRGYGSDGASDPSAASAPAAAAFGGTESSIRDTTYDEPAADSSATTAYDHPGQYGLSGSAVTSGYGAYAGAPATTPPAATATATTERASDTTSSRTAARARGPRRASLQLRHINPWTVLKFSCVLAIALFFVWLIIVGVLFGILDAAGVVGKINETATTINGPGSKSPITVGVVFGGAALVGVVNVILFIALSTVGSIIYNLCADLVGGVEVTLSET